MNLANFENSPAGQVITIGQDKAAYQAFVPHPLPPTITLNVELVRILSEADRKLGELAGLGRNMLNPQLLIRPFWTHRSPTYHAFTGKLGIIAITTALS